MTAITTHTHTAKNGSTRPIEAQPQSLPAGMKKRGKKGPEGDYQQLIDTMLETRKVALWELCALLDGLNPTAESLLHEYLGIDVLCNAVLSAIPLTEQGEQMARKSISSIKRKIKKLHSEDSSHDQPAKLD